MFNVVLSTVRALSWVAETLHRLHDFWSRSATHTCAETLRKPEFVRPFHLSTIAFEAGSDLSSLKTVRTPMAIFGSLGVCIYVPASRHLLISYSPIHLT